MGDPPVPPPGRQPTTLELFSMLVQQQQAMLNVQAEGLRLQRLFLEQLGITSPAILAAAPPFPTAPAVPTPAPIPASAPEPARPAPEQEVPADGFPPPDEPPAPELDEVVASGTRDPVLDGEVRSVPKPGIPAPGRQGWRVLKGAKDSRQSAPVGTSMDVLKLKMLAGSGAAINLVLTFGPHQGKTLRHVALEDPTYLQTLVAEARQPELRHAAREIVKALGLNERRFSRRPRGGSPAPPPGRETHASGSA